MTSLLTVRQELSSIRHSGKKGQRLFNDAEILQQAGFYSATVGNHNWPGVHEWCKQQFGKDHYTWTGSRFWFETKEAAVLFTLRWG